MGSTVQPGAIIDGKYRVLRRIGEGGMGTVYEGENIRIERRVAIKVLHEHVASSPEFAQRFEREARASARIGSPHVCDVLDLGDLPDGERFIVMEFLEGESLEERLEKGKLTAAQLAPFAFEILEGLGTMHQAGVIHRDLKPANIFLCRRPNGKTEVVKILDFGVAKILPRADEPNEMTSTGMMMGTPLYMSPEQARGARDVDGRTDLYAASVIFYRALTGDLPHSGLNLHELLFKIVLEDPRPICELAPEVDEAFAAIVTKGLARDADQRFSSAREYQEEIAAWGMTQGRASLAFAVTLPSEPPPLRNLSGGYPIARLQTPITGPQLRSEAVGPPTPAVAKSQSSAQYKTAAHTPSGRQSGGMPVGSTPGGGTPTAWADDAPEVAKRALAELEASRRASSAGDTKILAQSPMSSAASVAPATPAPVPSRPQTGVRVVLGVGALLVIAAVVGGFKLAGSTGPVANAATGSASAPPVTPEAPPVAATASSVTTVATTVESAPPSTVAAPSAIVSVAGATPRVATTATATTKLVPSAGAASAKTSAPPIASSAPTPAPTGSHRKFRTNLE